MELALHRQRDQQLLSHQPKTTFLRGVRVGEERDAYRLLLADPPASPARLPQGVDGIAGLDEENRRKGQQVEPGLHELRMANADLHPVPQQIGKHTSELQSPYDLVCRLLLEKK